MRDITKREYFAAMAMQGLLAHHGTIDDENERAFRSGFDEEGNLLQPDVEGYIPKEYYTNELADYAVAYADELIRNLSRGNAQISMSEVEPTLSMNGDLFLLHRFIDDDRRFKLENLVSDAVERAGDNVHLLDRLVTYFEECTNTLKKAVSSKT